MFGTALIANSSDTDYTLKHSFVIFLVKINGFLPPYYSITICNINFFQSRIFELNSKFLYSLALTFEKMVESASVK